MDFAKAFDKVSHWRLAIKLKNYGVTGQVYNWIVDFLHQRSQRVVCNGDHSGWAPVLSGVPQGSVIGPILFLVYINDLPKEVNATVRLFADDTIMYMAMSGSGDSTSLQQDLDRLTAWEEKWKMEFHPQKCGVLPITRSSSPQINRYQLHGHTLKTETDSKYLGITINSKLSWNNHIGNVCTKANSSIGFFVEIFKYHNNKLNQMSTQPLSILKWSTLLQSGIPTLEKTLTSLKWCRDGLPDMCATTISRWQVLQECYKD